jgi:hypothetical protein
VIGTRRWESIKSVWLENVPIFSGHGAKPDPGLENLPTLQAISFPQDRAQFNDVSGVRSNLLAEAVFLFHKCAHAHLASHRLGTTGMHSWSMWNAYHSAYLGARGLLALLGVGLFLTRDVQFLIDVFPSPESPKGQRQLAAGAWVFNRFLLVRFGIHFDQQQLWEAFKRVIEISEVPCWDRHVQDELREVPREAISRPRNAFLYTATFWPGEDLLTDGTAAVFTALGAAPLDPAHDGFLLRLGCNVYRLFEQLICDLAVESSPIRDQLEESRIAKDPEAADLFCYNNYLRALETG